MRGLPYLFVSALLWLSSVVVAANDAGANATDGAWDPLDAALPRALTVPLAAGALGVAVALGPVANPVAAWHVVRTTTALAGDVGPCRFDDFDGGIAAFPSPPSTGAAAAINGTTANRTAPRWPLRNLFGVSIPASDAGSPAADGRGAKSDSGSGRFGRRSRRRPHSTKR